MPYATKEARRTAYRLNPGPALLRRHLYRLAHKEEIRQKKFRHRMTAKGRSYDLFTVARKRALKKGVEFTITREWVLRKLADRHCDLSGLEFIFKSGENHHPYAPSIDRIDAGKGYTLENCRMILWCLNTALGSWGEEAAITAWQAVLTRRNNGSL